MSDTTTNTPVQVKDVMGFETMRNVLSLLVENKTEEARALLVNNFRDKCTVRLGQISEGDVQVIDATTGQIAEGASGTAGRKGNVLDIPQKSTLELVTEAAMKVKGYRNLNKDQRTELIWGIANDNGLLEKIKEEEEARQLAESGQAPAGAVAGDGAADEDGEVMLPSEIVNEYTSQFEDFEDLSETEKNQMRKIVASKLGILEDLEAEIKAGNEFVQKTADEVEAEKAATIGLVGEDEEFSLGGDDEGGELGGGGDADADGDMNLDDVGDDMGGDVSDAETVDGDDVAGELEDIKDGQKEIMDLLNQCVDEFKSITGGGDADAVPGETGDEEVAGPADPGAGGVVPGADGGGADAGAGGQVPDANANAGQMQMQSADPESNLGDGEIVVSEERKQKIKEYVSKVASPKKPMVPSSVKSPTANINQKSPAAGHNDKKFTIGKGDEKGRVAPKPQIDLGCTTISNLHKISIKSPKDGKKAPSSTKSVFHKQANK